MNNLSLRKITAFSVFLILLSACDFSTHKYVNFQNESSDYASTIDLGWDVDSNCSIYNSDTTIIYDKTTLYFYKDQTTVSSLKNGLYDYIFKSNDELDSVLVFGRGFDLSETGKLVKENDSILVKFYLGNKLVQQDTLYKRESESTFAERLPLPRLH